MTRSSADAPISQQGAERDRNSNNLVNISWWLLLVVVGGGMQPITVRSRWVRLSLSFNDLVNNKYGIGTIQYTIQYTVYIHICDICLAGKIMRSKWQYKAGWCVRMLGTQSSFVSWTERTEDKCWWCRCCLLLMAGCYYFLSWSPLSFSPVANKWWECSPVV